MPNPSATTSRAQATRALAFWIVLILGAFVRLYRVDVPSMWWDEILVPLTSSHSGAYIVDFCRSAEMHPPLFYFFSKACLSLGVSDFWVRLPSVALGVVGLWSLYRVGAAFTDRDTALLAMALLAGGGLHVLLSREIRPYALEIVLLLWAWLLLVRLAESWRWRDLAGLALLNALLLLLHYFALHLVLAQGIFLGLVWLRSPSRARFARLFAFCLATLAVALPVLWFFFLPSSGSRSIFTLDNYTRADVLGLILDYLGLVLHFFAKGWPVALMAALAGFGLLVLAGRNTLAALSAFVLCAVPAFDIWAMGKAAYFSPWHLAYVAPFACLCAACALGLILRRPALRQGLACALALLLCANIATNHFERFYQPDSYKHPAFITLYKLMSQALSSRLAPDDAVVPSQPGFRNGVRWYMDQNDPANPLRRQEIAPERQDLTLRFLSATGKDWGVFGPDEAAFVAKHGSPDSAESVENARMLTYRLRRDPVEVLTALPFSGGLKAGLAPFYSRVHRLQDAVYMPWGPDGVTPTDNARPGVLEYVLENAASDAPQTIFVNLFYANTGQDNLLGLFTRFDDEPLTPLAGSQGPDRKRQRQAVIRRDKPYKRLLFRVEMRLADKTALYHGGNQETLAFRELQVFACPTGDCQATQAHWEHENLTSLRQNYDGEGFAAWTLVRQRLTAGPDNLADVSTGEVPGWRVYTPADPERPATLTLEVEPGRDMVFFPRLGGAEAQIAAWLLEPDGTRREVFLLRGAPELWTPLSARFALDLPPGSGFRTVQLELKGRFSQLWHKDGLIFF